MPCFTLQEVDGGYILRLTASDAYGNRSDDVTILVNPPLPSKYAAWADKNFTHHFTAIDPNENQYWDGKVNLLEFAFGTDPTVSGGGVVAGNGSAHGNPLLQETGAAGTYELFFVRRDDHGTSGSVSYTVQFSSDLVTFYDSPVTPTLVTDSSVDSDYEVVKVAYPASLPNGQAGRFGRIKVDFVP